MSHFYAGIVGGIVFGLMGGLLLGSCVFKAGPNRQAVALERPGPGSAGVGQGSAGSFGGNGEPAKGGKGGEAPGGMDPGSGTMEAVFARVSQLKAAIQASPRDRGALTELANLYYDAGKFDQAIPYYESALTVERSDPNLLTDTGNCYWQTGNTGKALELFQEAQTKFPNHWQSAANLFFLAASLNDSNLAGEALGKVRRLNPAFEKLPDMERIYGSLKKGGGA